MMQQSQLKRRLRNYLPSLPGDIFKILVCLAFVFPFYWMIVTSFKTYNESIITPPTLWPRDFTFENFTNIFEKEISFGRYFQNSVIVTAAIIVIQLVVMVPAAYAFAKRSFPFKGILFGVVLVAFMIPGQVTYIPIYLMMAKAKLISSLWPQILPFGANAFGIFMLRQAFKQVPDELLESARLDSATEFQIVTRIMLPMAKAALITICLFSFIGTWNSYFWPLVMTNNDKFRPLTMYIERVQDADVGNKWNQVMAANVLLVGPVLVIYLFASQKIIQAFTYNGVK